MMDFKSWKADLERVLPHLQRVALGSAVVGIFPLSDRVALGLPRDQKLAREVIRLYRPMKWKARLFAHLLEGVSRTGVLRLFRSKGPGEMVPEISWLQGVSDLGFLGCHPGHGIRCVLLSREEDGGLRVTKVAIGGKLAAVVAEGETLRELGARYRGVVTFGEAETGDGWAAFWTPHVAGKGPQSVLGEGVIDLLEGWLRPEKVTIGNLSWVEGLSRRLPEKTGERLKAQEIRAALVHGDFAPWNLRGAPGGLVAIDWEWAREDGLGGLDIGHGLLMEALLVKGLAGADLVEAVLTGARQEGIAGYLERCGWGDLNLWCLLSLLYSGDQTGQEMARELTALQNRMEQPSVI